jgi:hypothetical protein
MARRILRNDRLGLDAPPVRTIDAAARRIGALPPENLRLSPCACAVADMCG